ncbi:MAG: hypothetical protein CME01_00035 [Geminicoccus sp.]|nr:hypothetical protein [Geminicoccus sp.]
MDSFDLCCRASEKASWLLEEEVSALHFDYSKAFLPSKICGHGLPSWLSASEQIQINHVRAYSYAHCFFVLEQFILQETCEAAQGYVQDDRDAMSALLKFADEETKHQRLFLWVKNELQETLGIDFQVVDGVNKLADDVCGHCSFAVFLVTLCTEWLTQRHYVECFQEENRSIDSGYQRVFRLHWTEEAQHARIDALHLRRLASEMSDAELAAAVEEASSIFQMLHSVVSQQDELDVANFEALRSKPLSPDEKASILAVFRRDSKWTFFESGLEHRAFRLICEEILPGALAQEGVFQHALAN